MLFLISYTQEILAQHDSIQKKKLLTQKEALKMGDQYLFGINTSIDYKKAFAIYQILAHKENEEAMNKLAGMYRQGFGTEQSADSAILYFRKASEKGYGKATYNLMNMYRQGEGITQDFDSAYFYAQKAYEQGYIQKATFSLGYFHMKGLGTEQSYEKAMDYYMTGANAGSGICTYYVGYLYIGGFGVEQNIDKGMQYMEKSVSMGCDAAVSFIVENRVERYLPGGAMRSASQSRKDIKPFSRRKNTAQKELSGIWDGKLIRYDWSGQKIVEEKNLSLQLDFYSNQLSGIWIQDDSISMRITGHLEDSIWLFDQMHYLDTRIERPWEIRNGAFQIRVSDGKEIMEGNIEQYSSTIKEKSSPMALKLSRTAKGEEMEKYNSRTRNSLNVSPNPFDNELKIRFSISKTQIINLHIYDIEGHTVYNSTIPYEVGEHCFELNLQVPSGTYCVSIKGETVNLTSLVIKQ